MESENVYKHKYKNHILWLIAWNKKCFRQFCIEWDAQLPWPYGHIVQIYSDIAHLIKMMGSLNASYQTIP